MRKIISKKYEEKKNRRNQIIIGILLVLIMFLSVLGYSFGADKKNKNEELIYNTFKFIKEENMWNVNVENYQFSFRYNPNEVDKLNSFFNKIDSYFGEPLYVYSEDYDAEIEIYKNLFYQNKIVQRMQYACLEGEKCEKDSPIKTCADNFIIIKEKEENRVMQEENCVFIEGKKEDLIKLSDSFLFRIIGIQ